MPTYSFTRLSPYDFEELVGDLLSASWRRTLERFTAGRDGGIDLRGFTAAASTIVQCKHQPGIRFATLLSSFKRNELPKLNLLKPRRYVFVTSAGLTPADKDALLAAATPYIVSTADIMGRDDLNALLREHPKVETANFKLWFTSAEVMRRVLHNAEQCQTEFEVERVTAALPIFVQSQALPRALAILKRSRIAVISGVPGIGKTTLADMLLYSHLEQGFEPVVIQSSVEEARKLFDKRKKQIFYFDDFLGETFLHDGPGVYEKNQDAALINFMEAVKRTKRSRFILTTREHILRNALASSERLAASDILTNKCVLELADYSARQKARILYNHLFFGDLPSAYKQELMRDDFFLRIVKHKNFSPRLISWLAGFARARNVAVTAYQDHVQALLDKPESIWRHAFENQISAAARSVLLGLASLGRHADVVDLRPVWDALHDHNVRKYNLKTAPNDFRRALQELEGSFISLNAYGVDFLNPSIRDFLHLVLLGDDNYADDIIASAVRFCQVERIRDLAVEKNAVTLIEKTSVESPPYLAALSRTVQGPHLRWTKSQSGTRGTYIDTSPEGRVRWLLKWANDEKSATLSQLVSTAFDYLQLSNAGVPDFNAVMGVVEGLEEAGWFAPRGGGEMREMIIDLVFDNIAFARYYEWDRLLEYADKSEVWSSEEEQRLSAALAKYQEDWAYDEVSDCSGDSDLSELKTGLEGLAIRYGLSFSGQISRIEDRLAEVNSSEDEGYRGSSFVRRTSRRALSEAPATDEELRDMFRSLPVA